MGWNWVGVGGQGMCYHGLEVDAVLVAPSWGLGGSHVSVENVQVSQEVALPGTPTRGMSTSRNANVLLYIIRPKDKYQEWYNGIIRLCSTYNPVDGSRLYLLKGSSASIIT